MSRENILITGADGMIGRAIDFGVKCTRTDFDIESPGSVRAALDKHRPQILLHLAAKDIGACAEDPIAAFRVNVLATRDLAIACQERGILIAFVSSGTVFCGAKGSVFSEASVPCPCNAYGMSKLLGELAIRDNTDDYLIVRTSWLFGGNSAHRPKFVDTALQAAAVNRAFWANADQEGSPTYVKDFVAELETLLSKRAKGLFHLVNEGAATAYDLASEIVRFLDSASEISQAVPQEIATAIQRSPSEALSSNFIKLRTWRAALHDYLQLQAPDPTRYCGDKLHRGAHGL